MEIGTTKLSSKGQIIIPKSMRDKFNPGDKLVVMSKDGRLIIKKADKLDENFSEDLEFAKRTEEAYKRVEKGEYISVDSGNLFEEMAKW